MSNLFKSREWKIHAVTDVWTGGVDRRGGLHTTGLLGSIRWWFEVLVRGLEGYACDPTNHTCSGEDHCVACELFGCTGWARKFRFDVLEVKPNSTELMINGGEEGQDGPALKAGHKYIFRFTPLRPIIDEEWTLLNATLRLIADYGALGGRTVYKPSDEPKRAKAPHHKDYGIIKVEQEPQNISLVDQNNIKVYVQKEKWKDKEKDKEWSKFSWASLENFWCVKGWYLTRVGTLRSNFNEVLCRYEDKTPHKVTLEGQKIKISPPLVDLNLDKKSESELKKKVFNARKQNKRNKEVKIRETEYIIKPYNKASLWLAGKQQVSKKIFSFKEPPRTFGFIKPELIDFSVFESRLKKIWEEDGWNFDVGGGTDGIMTKLFPSDGVSKKGGE